MLNDNLNCTEHNYTEYNFEKIVDNDFPVFELYKDLSECEITVGLISDIAEMHNKCLLINYGYKYNGYIGKKCVMCHSNLLQTNLNVRKQFWVYNSNVTHLNCKLPKCKNIKNNLCLNWDPDLDIDKNDILIINIETDIDNNIFQEFILDNNLNLPNYIIYDKQIETEHKCFYVDTIKKYLYVSNKNYDLFYKNFYYYIKDNKLNYNNLIHLVMIVKNAGDNFKNVLLENYNVFDRYTILDTGSTDNTVQIIKEVLKDKKGNVYEEPFINFRESRNRSLDLAGNNCKFNLILDDTYIIRGNLRDFLSKYRSDQFSTSYSLFIKSDDVVYASNRIVKSEFNLRYIYKIHEVITDKNNINVMIPIEYAYIEDKIDKYMEERTYNRKQLDIKLLNEMIEEDPENPRHYYYLAQTYKLLNDFNKTEENYLKRIYHKNQGFKSELVDSCFELARVYNFNLNKDWDICMKYYMMAYELDNGRDESFYFIGIHYFLENNIKLAHEYFKKSFEIGFNVQKQYSLKPTLSFKFLPYYLVQTCYINWVNEPKTICENSKQHYELNLGIEVLNRYFLNNKSTDEFYNPMIDWLNIYNKLLLLSDYNQEIVINKRITIFIADGGFSKWNGNSIYTGIGGSESHIIEIARNWKRITNDEVIVFCNTDYEMIEGVKYIPLNELYNFIRTYSIEICFISRYSEYIPVAIHSYIKNIYIFVHDLTLTGNIIPLSPKIKKIFCLTNWHKNYFINTNPKLEKYVDVLGHGIDKVIPYRKKQKYKFIYSSFANRGLYPLLLMWDDILKIYPTAELHIYCDLNNEWLLKNHKEVVINIKLLLDKLKNVYNHGWVSKNILYESWASADIWLYPCTFMETYCVTALEAALSKTLVITNNLAGLSETVGDRGIIVEGDPMTLEWRNKVLEILRKETVQDRIDKVHKLIELNSNYVFNMSWDNIVKKLIILINNFN